MLINCAIAGISPVGWGPVGGDTTNMHLWEYNSTNISDGKPADVSRRHPASRQLTMEKDSAIIADYTNPAYVLGGWTPTMAPIILSQPKAVKAEKGQAASFNVEVAAIPDANYQWLKNGQAISGATNAVLSIESVNDKDAGNYSVTIKNRSGSVTSHEATLTVM